MNRATWNYSSSYLLHTLGCSVTHAPGSEFLTSLHVWLSSVLLAFQFIITWISYYACPLVSSHSAQITVQHLVHNLFEHTCSFNFRTYFGTYIFLSQRVLEILRQVSPFWSFCFLSLCVDFKQFNMESTPDIAPPTLSAHVSLWTEIL